MRKEGQITVFVILGLVLVLATILIIYITQYTTLFRPKEVVAPWVQPLVMDVDNCLQRVGGEGANLMALQGGYLEAPPALAHNPFAQMPIFGPFSVPLWRYRGHDFIPTRADMEDGLSSYVDDRIISCLDNFTAHRGRYDIEELGAPRTNVTIGDRQVIFELSYPLDVVERGGEEKTSLTSFYATANLSLGRLHTLATEIMAEEDRRQFLENFTMETIAGSGMPYEGMELTCAARRWSVSRDLKPQLQQLLKYNLHYMNIIGTNRPASDYPYFDKVFRVDLPDDFPDVRVSTDATFSNSWWMKLAVRPGSGDKVSALEVKAPLIGSCIKIYHHKYSMTYPVLFQLVDPSGFTFNFATPVSIKDNQPVSSEPLFPFDEEDTGATDSEYCDSADQLVEVYARDANTDAAIRNVSVAFRCVRARCDMGNTQRPYFPGTTIENSMKDPSLITHFSQCLNGLFIGTKEGYMTGYAFADTMGDQPASTVTIPMIPLRSFTPEVRVVEYPSGTVRRLAPDESAVINILDNSHNYDKTILWPGDENVDLLDMSATYDLTVQVVRNDSLVGYLESSWTPVLSGDKIYLYVISTNPLPQDQDGFTTLFNLVDAHSGENLPKFI